MAFEAGAAASILMLAAKAYSISSCCLGISDETNIQHILNAPQQYEPIVVIALGYGAQESRIVPLQESNRYYRDGNGTLNVPKINIDDVIIYSDIKIG